MQIHDYKNTSRNYYPRKYKSRLYLHKEFIETPMRVGSPPLLKSILSLVI